MLPWLRNVKHGVFLQSFRSEYSGLYLLQMIMGLRRIYRAIHYSTLFVELFSVWVLTAESYKDRLID